MPEARQQQSTKQTANTLQVVGSPTSLTSRNHSSCSGGSNAARRRRSSRLMSITSVGAATISVTMEKYKISLV